MSKSEIKLNITTAEKQDGESISTENSILPSVYGAKIQAYRTCPRKALSIQQIPELVMQDCERLAKEKGMTKKQFFYEMLRSAGADIPPYNEIHKTGGF